MSAGTEFMPNGATRTARLSQSAVNIGGVVTAVGLTCVLLFIVWALVYVEIPQQNVQLLTLTIGALLGAFATMVAFYFSGSINSAQSADTNNKLATANLGLQNAVKAAHQAPPDVVIPPGGTATVAAEPANNA
jgi:hypothetical protein